METIANNLPLVLGLTMIVIGGIMVAMNLPKNEKS